MPLAALLMNMSTANNSHVEYDIAALPNELSWPLDTLSRPVCRSGMRIRHADLYESFTLGWRSVSECFHSIRESALQAHIYSCHVGFTAHSQTPT